MEIKERKDIEEKYKWNLSSLFKSDEAWQEELSKIDDQINSLAKYQGKINNAKDIKEFLDANFACDIKVWNLFSYTSLRKVEDTRDSKAQAMFNTAYGKYVAFDTITSYFRPELLSNDDETLNKIVNDELLKDYKIYLEEIIRIKPHTLSTKEEYVLSSLGEVTSLPEQITTMLTNADMKFEDVKDSKGNTHEVSESTYSLIMSSKDRTLRENGFKEFYKGYINHVNTLSTSLIGYFKTTYALAKLRGYKTSRQAKMDSDNIPESVYDNLIDTIHTRLNLLHRYAKLRKKILGIDELHYYDLYAPLAKDIDKTYTYDDAKKIVLNTVKPLGEEYVNRVKEAYDNRWIDVYPNVGKESGAFSSGTYTSNPFIKMNFNGTLESVSTLAHEMGHSQHTWLTNHNQPVHYSGYTMFVAEVASTVNENLMYDYLLKEEKDLATRLYLINDELELYKGTIYRQTLFAEFEKLAHQMYEEGKDTNIETLNELYGNLVKEYFGEALVLDNEVKYEWTRIPHFFYNFYVYVYATGCASACAISEMISSGKENAVKNYLEFLSMGSSLPPLEELKHAGVDLTTPEPINIALDKFEKLLDEAEEIVEKLNK